MKHVANSCYLKQISLNEEQGLQHDKHLNICTVFRFSKQKTFHVSASIMSVKKTASHLFRDFSIQQQIPVAATVQVEINNSRIQKNEEFQILMVLPNRSSIRKIKNISKSQIM
jgi:hypothetical protein